MAKFYRKLRRPLENGALYFARVTIPFLPRRALLALARFGGFLGYHLDRRGRKIGLANLDIAFGGQKTAEEKKAILRQSFTSFARTLLDVFWFAHQPEKRLDRWVEISENIRIFFNPTAQICITAHFGNWEILGQVTAQRGFPMHSIAMPIKNKAADRIFIDAREATGQKIVPRNGALRKLLKVLRNDGKTAFLVDQNTTETDGGIWVNFFGLPAPVTAAPAVLAYRTGTDILIGFSEPLPDGRYRMYLRETLTPPPSSSELDTENVSRELTEQILHHIEEEIRRHPEHWLWMYKRWKFVKPGDDTTAYPWYSDRPKPAVRAGNS